MSVEQIISQPEFDLGIEQLIAQVECALQGQHVHRCFVCRTPFKCGCADVERKLICPSCDWEDYS